MKMKVARIKKNREVKREKQEETYTLKGMIKILVFLIIAFLVFYFITNLIVNHRKEQNDGDISVVDSSKITLNQILNRKENEYYVIATMASLYNSSYIDTNYINFYNDYINSYKQKEGSYTFYYVDLDDALNKNNISDELNITDDISKLKLNDEILFKIKAGSIEKTYVGKEKILDKLSRLEKEIK